MEKIDSTYQTEGMVGSKILPSPVTYTQVQKLFGKDTLNFQKQYNLRL